MAIQVNGTTVIDDSRNLSNVGGLKTVGGTSILGSGDISLPTGGPGIGVTKTSLGTSSGANSGGGTVSCAAGKWYAVTCSSDNQGSPISANAGSGGVCVEINGSTSPVLNNLGLNQNLGKVFYAQNTTTVAVTGNRGRVYVHRID